MKISLVYVLALNGTFPHNSVSIVSLSSRVLTDDRILKPFSLAPTHTTCFLEDFRIFISSVIKFHNDKLVCECSLATAWGIWAFSICRLLSFGSGEFSSIISLIICSSVFSLFAEILQLGFQPCWIDHLYRFYFLSLFFRGFINLFQHFKSHCYFGYYIFNF